MSVNFYRKFHNQIHNIYALNDRSDNDYKLDKHDLQPEI